jgi:hypothetical protein
VAITKVPQELQAKRIDVDGCIIRKAKTIIVVCLVSAIKKLRVDGPERKDIDSGAPV